MLVQVAAHQGPVSHYYLAKMLLVNGHHVAKRLFSITVEGTIGCENWDHRLELEKQRVQLLDHSQFRTFSLDLPTYLYLVYRSARK